MRFGELNLQIGIKAKTITRDSYGAEIPGWTTLATVWASKAHKSSREFFAAQKINAETTDLFTVRYRRNIEATMRVGFDGKNYNIIGANDPDGRRVELWLLCKEVS